MAKNAKRLARLTELLNALQVESLPMTLSELDGYITGVLACPEMIPPMLWMPQVWRITGDAYLVDQKVPEETIGAVMEHYNALAKAMTWSRWVAPIYEVDSKSGETLWEPWVDGFSRAMDLRPDAWEGLLDRADEETQASLIFLIALQDISMGNSKFSKQEIEQIDQEAPDLILNCVATILLQSRPELAGTVAANLSRMPHKGERRPERNDPCSCGSGKKYKLCCGRN
ncbi:uncharacterized protein C7964_11157 [Loktanella sp. PT4BL]|jgi:uncharacterized protein|uniref:UPF0149 family protein n=1 Tax=Loktanella sp. PT4BL TaxID=2135611 RepID=UPI000D754BEB|nr:UPF0149 family protein [Loktanella sp. PT4BL]PXW66256.1 uncharacterized protein C7964_11157 [Loktanella sp. PT4BL]